MNYWDLTGGGDYLSHYGIKGQKHGVRRWQNYDGTLTPAGRARYGIGNYESQAQQMEENFNNAVGGSFNDAWEQHQQSYQQLQEEANSIEQEIDQEEQRIKESNAHWDEITKPLQETLEQNIKDLPQKIEEFKVKHEAIMKKIDEISSWVGGILSKMFKFD